ncbi:MAG: MBL fold metallo-hydrolase, partial [Desulfofustis sp.]
KIIVPVGLKDYVATLHDGEIVELDWWESVEAGPAQVTGLPAQHWSRRIGQGRNETLWASYMIDTPAVTIYYGADSGYFVGYREFGKMFEPIDYALLPISAYQPRWFMHYAHINVDEALLAFEQLGAHWFVPTQWGTFRLGDNPPGYPILDLKRQLADRELDPAPYLMPDLGEIVVIGK